MIVTEKRLEVDLDSEEGIKRFQEDSGDIFKSIVLELLKIRELKNLTHFDKSQVATMHELLRRIATSTTPYNFRQQVSVNDIQVFIEYTTMELIKLTSKPRYVKTGALDKHECVLIPLADICYHTVPGAFAFQSEFFEVLAAFAAAPSRSPNRNRRRLPSPENCRLICEIVSNAFIASTQGFDNKWSAEKVFKKLEACGILQQFFRCLTVPESMDSTPERIRNMLAELQNCASILNKNFQRGEPCGDTLIDIIEGRDGSTERRVEIAHYLQMLRETAIAADPTRYHLKQTDNCTRCGKEESSEGRSLMTCARCKVAQYCSKSCQKAHWRYHKQYCAPFSKQGGKKMDFLSKAIQNFLDRYYVNLMLSILRECERTGVDMNEMIIELNFSPDDDGVVPAVVNPPIFKVTPARRYIEGSQRETPDWIRKGYGPEFSEKAIQNIVALIKSSIDKQPRQTTIVAHYADCIKSMTPHWYVCLVKSRAIEVILVNC